jgi:hypothetical protein
MDEIPDKTIWYKFGTNVKHRDEKDLNGLTLPAAIYANGTKKWYINGQLHNDTGPALITDGGSYYYKFGKLHRDEIDENGERLPAVICDNGYRGWYNNGECLKFQRPENSTYLQNRNGIVEYRKMSSRGYIVINGMNMLINH